MTVDLSAGACIGMDGNLWFANAAQDAADTTQAIRVCWGCQVREACLRQAMAREGSASRHDRHGVLGGLRAGQRATLARRLPGVTPKAALQPCGTVAAYDRHLAKGESCEACTKAASAYRRSRRQVRAA